MDERGLMSINEMREHEWEVSFSGGKDSACTAIVMHELGIPIKRLIYARMMYDEKTAATLPIMTDFVDHAKQIFESWGVPVEIIKSKKTAKDLANAVYGHSKFPGRAGHKYGITAFCRGMCKFQGVKESTIHSLQNPDAYEMIGYAADEAERLHRLGGKKQSMLVACGIKEKDTFDICRRYGLLSPLYELGLERDGCWFCPNCRPSERALIKEKYPELFQEIKALRAMSDYDIYGLYKTGRCQWLRDSDVYQVPEDKEPKQYTLAELFPDALSKKN